MWCVADNHSYIMCQIHVQKDFQLLTKYQIFAKLPQISHIYENHKFLSTTGTLANF